jgi:hypothetical protein
VGTTERKLAEGAVRLGIERDEYLGLCRNHLGVLAWSVETVVAAVGKIAAAFDLYDR